MLVAPVGVVGGPTGWLRALRMLGPPFWTACTNSPGVNTAALTVNASTLGTSRARNAFGTTRNTPLLMSGVTTGLAGPVTDAAAAPIALSGEPVDASDPRNVGGACATAMGTLFAPCTANGQIRLQY